MKRLKLFSLLLLILGLTSVAVWFGVTRNGRNSSTENSIKFPPLKIEEIETLTIESSKDKVELVKIQGNWQFSEPFEDNASNKSLQIWLGEIQNLKGIPVEVPENRKSKNIYRLGLGQNSPPVSFEVWREGEITYLLVNERVWQLDEKSKGLFALDINRFREHPFQALPEILRQIHFSSEKFESFEWARKKAELDDWVREVRKTPVLAYLDDPEMVRKLLNTAENNTTATLTFHSENPPDTILQFTPVIRNDRPVYLLQVEGRKPGFLVDTSFASRLMINKYQFMSPKELIPFEVKTIGKITYKDQKGSIRLWKSASGTWTSEAPSPHWNHLAQKYLDKLTGLRALIFYDSKKEFTAGSQPFSLKLISEGAETQLKFGEAFIAKSIWPGTKKMVLVKRADGQVFAVSKDVVTGLRRPHLTP